MPPTALIFLPARRGNPSSLAQPTTSPTSTLITHISRTYSPKPLGAYTLDHRLLVDTSSLLPGHTGPRRYTHFLTLSSQNPGRTFVGTSAADPTPQANESPNGSAANSRSSTAEYSLSTIPSQLDTLFPLLMQKMSPLWVARQAHRVDGGTSFLIGDWKVRLGELRISGGQGQGRVRGCVCEVEFLFGDDGEEEEEDHEEIERLARAFFEGLIHGSDVDLAGMKVVGTAASRENRLVRQYMELFKFAKT